MCVVTSVLFLSEAQAAPELENEAKTSRGVLGSSVFDVLTQHNDSQRTGATLHETLLTPERVNKPGQFGWLFDWEVDGQIYAQPLYVSHVPYGGRLINMVIVATMNNSVYAFEAPAAENTIRPSKDPLWKVESNILGEPLPYNFFSMIWGVFGYNIRPLIGITATPVIDRERGTVYVSVKSADVTVDGWCDTGTYRLFAIDLLTGALKKPGKKIEARYPNQVPFRHESKFDPTCNFQRAGLLEANKRIYLAFASHQDSLPFHGWLLAYDADNLEQVAAYCTTCGEDHGDTLPPFQKLPFKKGGIWQAGGGPASDEHGNVYVITGDGSFEPAIGDLGESFIKLDPDLNVLGSWTPATYDCLNYTDADLGSAGPLFISGSSVLVGGGKEGILYALRPEALHHTHVGESGPEVAAAPCRKTDPTPKASGPGYWSIQASPPWEHHRGVDFLGTIESSMIGHAYHHIHGSPALWRVGDPSDERLLLYLSAERDYLRAYEFENDRGFVVGSNPGAVPKSTFTSRCLNSKKGMPGGFLTVSANGSDPESGIVWAAMPRFNEDALIHVVPGSCARIGPIRKEEASNWMNSGTATKVLSRTMNTEPAQTQEKQRQLNRSTLQNTSLQRSPRARYISLHFPISWPFMASGRLPASSKCAAPRHVEGRVAHGRNSQPFRRSVASW